jgi:hypothetical protein
VGRHASTSSHGSSNTVGVSGGGGWPAGINAVRLSSGSGDSHSRNSSISNVAGMMQLGMPAVGMPAVGGGGGGGCVGSLQALLMQLPVVQGGNAYPPEFNAGIMK